MPVKKTVKKNKKTHVAKTAKKIRREIKKAVEQLPGLLIEHVRFQELEKASETLELPEPVHHGRIETRVRQALLSGGEKIIRQKKLWLWTGVVAFTVLVFAMWTLNVRVMWQDSLRGENRPTSILVETKKEWQDIMKTAEGETKKTEEMVADIKEKLSSILLMSAIMPSSTTESMVTTTSSNAIDVSL